MNRDVFDMQKITINQTDIYLDDYNLGQGKITVSDSWRGAFTYYWGAMGSTLQEFICRIDKHYFAHNLCSRHWIYDNRRTLRNLRKYIRQELPWYLHAKDQKELRYYISFYLSSCDTPEDFVYGCNEVKNSLELMTSKEFFEEIEPIFSIEPWHFCEEKPSKEYEWLTELHGQLVKEFRKQKAA